MTIQFHVLASGSDGNASVLEADDFGILIDFGLSFRTLEQRMRRCSLAMNRIQAVLLTHTHGDHWHATTLSQLSERRVPIYCHAEHASTLERESQEFKDLVSAGCVRFYQAGQPFPLAPDCECLPFALSHDAAMTCGFRISGGTGRPWALGYAADLGCWTPQIAQHLADVDFLALEFNHDVALQLQSGRHPMLIRRVLSDEGHLSNDQAVALLKAILQISEPGRLQSLVQLHLSRQCNRPELARAAAQQVLRSRGEVALHTARQDRAGPSLFLRSDQPREPAYVQAMLPFAEEIFDEA